MQIIAQVYNFRNQFAILHFGFGILNLRSLKFEQPIMDQYYKLCQVRGTLICARTLGIWILVIDFSLSDLPHE